MSGAFVEIKVDDRLVLEALARLTAQAKDLRLVFEDIGDYLQRSHDERWKRAESPDGTPWAALSPAYAASKTKNKDKVLVLDGYLEKLHYQAGPDGLSFGTDRIYGAIHQFGAKAHQFGKAPWGDIPARPFLGLSDADRTEILEILGEHLLGA